MPVQVYDCPRGHTMFVRIPLKKSPGPKTLKCDTHLGGEGSTHYEGCAKAHACGKIARRREVYSVGVGGDLPTRGAF